MNNKNGCGEKLKLKAWAFLNKMGNFEYDACVCSGVRAFEYVWGGCLLIFSYLWSMWLAWAFTYLM